ncbi:MAG: hypothetical protein VB046_06775 [Paludibacter sp.]|nr:hypothetical protein [Paludibacter sp.]
METKITLTPEDASKITGLSVQQCIKIAFPDSFFGSVAELKFLRSKQFVLTDQMKFTNPQAIGNYNNTCLLRKAMQQSENNFCHFLYWVCQDVQNVKKIDLVGRFRAFKQILNPENRKKTICKLADIHLGKYGENTEEYKQYKAVNYVY